MIDDETWLDLFEKAEKAEEAGCNGATMFADVFSKKYSPIENSKHAVYFDKQLRTINCEDKTIHLIYKEGGLIIWKLVPADYKGKIGRTKWTLDWYYEYDINGNGTKKKYKTKKVKVEDSAPAISVPPSVPISEPASAPKPDVTSEEPSKTT